MVEMRPFDVQNYLKAPEERAAFIQALFEDHSDDPSFIAAGIGEIAKAIGVTEFARQSGLSREAVYKGLIAGGNPTLETLAKATKALGLRLTVSTVT